MAKLNFQYHPEIDMLEVEGLHFSGDYFRDLAECQKGDFLAIKCDGSTLYLERRPTKRAPDEKPAGASFMSKLLAAFRR